MTDTQARRVIHQGRRFRFEEIVVAVNGREVTFDVVRTPGAVVVVPVLDDGRVVLIRNQRHVVGMKLREFCAGTLEEGEDPAECARRELIEETGYEAGVIRPLGAFFTSPGISDEYMHAFLATRLRHVGQSLDDSEEIEVERRSPTQIWSMIESGEIVDGKSIAAWALYSRKT